MTTPTTLPILLQDESLLAIAKPAGIPVHGSGGSEETIETLLKKQLGARAVRSGFSLSAVHRLDRDTSGVLVLARRKRSCRRLMEQFAEGEVRKTYLALVLRGPAQSEGVIELPLVDLASRDKREQEAATEYRVLARAGEAALVECRPRTGRTHQIRRHLTAVGCPLAGDERYGSTRFNEHARALWGLERMFLHARALDLAHPDDGRPLHLEAPLPEELQRVLARAGLASEG